jgi:hypothetical protein
MFQSNVSLRKSGEKIDYTQDTINEMVKCKTDIVYFAEQYVYIIHPDRGKEKITLYDWQRKVLKACVETPDNKKHLIIRVPRQQGKCVQADTIIKIRNKNTGEFKNIKIIDLLK